eukprot:4372234-Alexandrium_andersonii.AAC.1
MSHLSLACAARTSNPRGRPLARRRACWVAESSRRSPGRPPRRGRPASCPPGPAPGSTAIDPRHSAARDRG